MSLRNIGGMVNSQANANYNTGVDIASCAVSTPGSCEYEVEKMAGTEVTIHNEIKIRVQAQIFIGLTLVSTCMAGPGEVCVLPSESTPFDIFFKNGVTGWEIARKLDSEAKTLTLSQHKGRYIIT